MKRAITTLAILLFSISALAQSGSADTIYVDVPAEVEALRLQTAECVAFGRKSIEKYGKRFLGYSMMNAWCYNGEPLDRKKFRALFKPIQYYPYDKVVFNGFVIDRLGMDYSTETGVIAGLLAGKKPVLTFRREADIRKKVDSLLCDVGRRDQAVRADWAKIVTGNVTREEAIEYALKMEDTDSTNLVVVSYILDRYGWLDGLSQEANKAIFLVIDHSDLETMNKYQSLFHKAADKGYISVSDLVTMKDRMQMNAGKPQTYGTQAYALGREGESIIYIWPVEEPDKLNERRKEVGLSPIEVYLETVKQQGVTIYFDPDLKVEDFKIQ